MNPVHDDIEVIHMTAVEWDQALTNSLDNLGLTWDQLTEQAKAGDFSSLRARQLWLMAGGQGPNQAEAELAELRARAEHAEGQLSALRDHRARWEAEKARAERAEDAIKVVRQQRDYQHKRADKAEEHRDAALRSSTELGKANVEWQRSHDEATRRAVAAEAQVAAIRTLITEDYGDDYDDEDVPAAVERLMRHLGEHEANVQRIQQCKNEALEKALAQVAALQRELADEGQRTGEIESTCNRLLNSCGWQRDRAEQAERELADIQEQRASWKIKHARSEDARREAEAKLFEVAKVKVWTNEDGKRFVFADDLSAILLPVTAPA